MKNPPLYNITIIKVQHVFRLPMGAYLGQCMLSWEYNSGFAEKLFNILNGKLLEHIKLIQKSNKKGLIIYLEGKLLD